MSDNPQKPKPTEPCSVCGSDDWWWRETFGPGKWLCGRCHPNPNKEEEENMKEEVELVGDKFLVKGKQGKEVKHKEIKVMPKQYSEEVITLKERVIKGNQILFDAWLRIKELAHDTEEWSKEMDRWHEAGKRLSLLCSELNHKGLDVCLYLDENGKKTKNCLSNPDGFWCLVCPSSYPYWEKELMDLPSAGGK